MPSLNRSVVLITGASSGIGRACAGHLHEQGYRVYGTSRRPAASSDIPFTLLQMDVTDEESVRRAVEQVVEAEGRLDVVMNNAGSGIAGAIEDTSIEEAQAQFDTNFFGMMRVCRAVLPVMREQGSGLIINVSSMAAFVGLPFQGLYSASKFAVEGLTEALKLEVEPFGVKVALLEPGDFRTGFTSQRRWVQAAQSGSVYEAPARRAVTVMEADEQNGSDPAEAARVVQRIIEAENLRMRYTTGPFPQRVQAALRGVLPRWFIEWNLRHYYQLEGED